MLVDILRIIFIAGGLAFVFMLVQACWQKKCNGTLESTPFWPVALIGGVANFLDTLGVGSFAVKTACYKQFKLIDDRLLPRLREHALPLVLAAATPVVAVLTKICAQP